MKIKTAEATGLQLDWGVAKALELKPSIGHNSLSAFVRYKKAGCDFFRAVKHTDPDLCVWLIEQYSLAFSECDTSHLYGKPDTLWRVVCRNGSGYGESKLLVKAVARCVIAMRLGDEFECPSELGVWFDELTNTERNA